MALLTTTIMVTRGFTFQPLFLRVSIRGSYLSIVAYSICGWLFAYKDPNFPPSSLFGLYPMIENIEYHPRNLLPYYVPQLHELLFHP